MRLQLHWRPLALRIWCAGWCLILAWLGLGYFRYPLCAGPGMKKRLPNPLLQPDRTGTTGNSSRPFPKTIRFKKGTRANSTSRRRIPISSTSFRCQRLPIYGRHMALSIKILLLVSGARCLLARCCDAMRVLSRHSNAHANANANVMQCNVEKILFLSSRLSSCAAATLAARLGFIQATCTCRPPASCERATMVGHFSSRNYLDALLWSVRGRRVLLLDNVATSRANLFASRGRLT